MELVQIYKCFCDETRLRILNLLTRRELCVCHFQEILGLSQVAVSKHLAYLRSRKLVTASRWKNWMVYRLPKKQPDELSLQLKCLQDCVQSHPVFKKDLGKLKTIRFECEAVSDGEVAKAATKDSCC